MRFEDIKVGQKVRYSQRGMSNDLRGLIGTVVELESDTNVHVSFGHPYDHESGWRGVMPDNLSLVEDEDGGIFIVARKGRDGYLYEAESEYTFSTLAAAEAYAKTCLAVSSGTLTVFKAVSEHTAKLEVTSKPL